LVGIDFDNACRVTKIGVGTQLFGESAQSEKETQVM